MTNRCSHASRHQRGVAITLLAGLLAVLAACGADSATAPVTTTPVQTGPPDTVPAFQGFDIALFPGTDVMNAWKYPSSPFRWVGYYLYAPCHRDSSFTGQYKTLIAAGWGVAAVYVGQQDWTQIPSDLMPSPLRASPSLASNMRSMMVTCSSTLLSSGQGGTEAADAVARMQGDGFPDHSVVFLDVEYVTDVTPALLDYYTGWIARVLQDGHYTPGVYAAKTNAQTLYDTATALYHAAGRSDAPPFWIASSDGAFGAARHPSDVGLPFARLWQGLFNVRETYNGVAQNIDVDLADKPSPSTP